MKLYLFAALLLATFVAVLCLDGKEHTDDAAKPVADIPEISGNAIENESEDTDEQMPKELQEEGEQEKRGFRQLSRSCCRTLRQNGLCRNPRIKMLCRATCKPRVCKDILSWRSCHIIKRGHGCRRHRRIFGLRYCRMTCGHCRLPKQCRAYINVNDKTRLITYQRRNSYTCDNRSPFARGAWVRFRVVKSRNLIPSHCVRTRRCGTYATGWVVNPWYIGIGLGQTVRRKVCYHWTRNCCRWSNFIKITRCNGFFVFFLRKPPQCNLRYCVF